MVVKTTSMHLLERIWTHRTSFAKDVLKKSSAMDRNGVRFMAMSSSITNACIAAPSHFSLARVVGNMTASLASTMH